ncbi:MAG: hypothetical protein LBO00_01170 [Zoogloeaceae bacterium]|nr:hypothetical protein [Zoogloeaceae bacterium]
MAQSVARTGLKAGGVFLGRLLGGILLSFLWTLGVCFAYMHLVLADGQSAPVAAHTGGFGAVIALIFFPEILVFLLLALYSFVYGALGFFYAWRHTLQTILLACSAPLADRLAGTMLARLAALPRTRETLRGAGNLVSEANLMQALESVADGQNVWLRRAARFALRRLPWADLLADWAAQTEAADEQKMLAERINDRLRQMTAPPRWPLILALSGQAALFRIGAWFAS